MKNTLTFITAITVSLSAFSQNEKWSQKQAPLMTEWAAKVNPDNPLPEYPRPQMVRSKWKSLNGIWEFQSGNAGDKIPHQKKLVEKILVPFPVESAISGVMRHHDRLWYKKNFSVPKDWAGKRIRLNFDAVDWESEVFLNGKSLGVHKGGYDGFGFDITPHLKSGEQELIVRVFDPTDSYGQPRGKQTTDPVGIMYTPNTGIWQSVWLEPVSAISISNLKLVPDVDGKKLKIKVNTNAAKAGLSVVIKANDGKSVISSVIGKANQEIIIPVNNPKLWSPDSPFLYDLKVSLRDNNKVVDEVDSYFGMRKISVEQVGAYKKIYLNNKFVYQMGVLDQGFWPDGIYTAPTDEALKYDLVQTKNMGFNLVRKHIKVEPQRWYYWADKLGLLVWQDMPSINSYLPEKAVRPALDKPQFKSELTEMIHEHWNSPSIIMWVLFNESQGQHDTPELVKYIQQTDPSRLVNEASGDSYFGTGDVIDRHNYPQPSCPESKTQAIVIGEFGGIGYRFGNHTWAKKAEGYTNAINPKDLIFLYEEFNDKLRDFRDQKGLSASIYTQITDVETETNGLMTYDRIPKWDVNDIKRLNTFSFPKPQYQAVIAVAEKEAQDWKYTTEQPASGWNQQNFEDASWKEGKGGFGKMRNFGNTPWTSQDIWLRKTFNPGNLTKDQINNLVIRLLYDREVEVYINGVSAFTDRGSRSEYENRTISQQAKDSIKPNGSNLLAVHARKRNGQFIDIGLYLRLPEAKVSTGGN